MKTKKCSLTGRAGMLLFSQYLPFMEMARQPHLPFMEMARQPHLPFMETASSNYLSVAK
jgi:hypothetical protein